MMKYLFATLFCLTATASFAACPSPITGKDGGGTTQNFGSIVDGSGNCWGGVGIVDGTAAAYIAAVKAASTAVGASDPALAVGISPNSNSVIVNGNVATGSALNGKPVLIGGSDGTNVQNIATDTGGHPIVGFVVNITPTNCSGTITAGGTAQNAFTAHATIHGFTLTNIDASAGSGEPLWYSLTTTAAAATAASYPLPAPATTTFAGAGSFTTPTGFAINSAVSVVAATTGHKFSCTYW